MNDLSRMYDRRFGSDAEFRDKMWKVLGGVFQKYVPEGAAVADIGAGYCEFINNIKAGRKIAVDLNKDVKKFANKDVETIISSSTSMSRIASGSVDVAFSSNFFEHLKREDIEKTIAEVHRILKKGGRFLILQPNIRFCYKDYWMFFDHVTPLDDRCLTELLELNGFGIREVKPRFLPYTTKGNLPKSVFLLKVYLKVSLLQSLIGKQCFIYAEKT
jgi:SAM-dependent methyltransferase